MDENTVVWLEDARACYEEISAACYHFAPAFRGRHILCPCGDAGESDFRKYFLAGARFLGLASLCCLDCDLAGQGRLRAWTVGPSGPETAADTEIPAHGEILEPFVQDLFDRCDVIVTMPPDSAFDDCLFSAAQRGKGFLLLGHARHSSRGPAADLMRQGRLWTRHGLDRRMALTLPRGGPFPAEGWWEDLSGEICASSPDVIWYGNLAGRR